MSNDELIYYSFLGLGLSIQDAKILVSKRREQLQRELTLVLALKRMKAEANRET